MKTAVYKYAIPAGHGPHTLHLPDLSRILHVAFQGEDLCLWARVYPEIGRHQLRTFHVVGTGWEMPDPAECAWNYLGTVHEGGFVWHVFEEVAS